MKKPRPYDGHVSWIAEAEEEALAWTDRTLEAVLAVFPYPASRGIRPRDWVALVAHVSTRKGEDPIQCAERLALYCRTYAETYRKTPTPTTIKESQTP